MTRAGMRPRRTVSALQIAGLVVIALLALRMTNGPRIVPVAADLKPQATSQGPLTPVSVDAVPIVEASEQAVEARRIRRARVSDVVGLFLAGILLALCLRDGETQARRRVGRPRRVLSVTWRDSLLGRGPPLRTT